MHKLVSVELGQWEQLHRGLAVAAESGLDYGGIALESRVEHVFARLEVEFQVDVALVVG